MKLVLIHGLAGDKNWELFKLLEKEYPENVVYVDYSDCYKEKDVIKRIKEKVLSCKIQEEHIVIGHSLGGLLAFYLQNEYTKGIVALAPALKLKKEIEVALLLELAVNKKFTFEGEHLVEIELEDYRELKELTKDIPKPKVPTMIVAGSEDLLIDRKYLYKFYKKYIEKGIFVEIKGAGHVFADFEKLTVGLIKTFIERLNR